MTKINENELRKEANEFLERKIGKKGDFINKLSPLKQVVEGYKKANRKKRFNIRRYWDCEKAEISLLPVIDISLLFDGDSKVFIIEVGWLKRWCSIEFEFNKLRS